MAIKVTLEEKSVVERLEKLPRNVRDALFAALYPEALAIQGDARQRAAAHIRFFGPKDPGSYVASIYGGVSSSKKEAKVLGYVRSSHPLAHLMELGFTIKDMMIGPKAGEIMAFAGDAGQVYTRYVHRHETKVRPYPAIYAAFQDARNRVQQKIENTVREAVAKSA